MNPDFIGLGAFALIVLFVVAFFIDIGRSKIRAPRLGFLNLMGEHGNELISVDKQALGSLFSAVEEFFAKPRTCDVLFIYCELTADGKVCGTNDTLQQIIRGSGARIAVVATENSPDAYAASFTKKDRGSTSIVFTLKRKGTVFPEFFSKLFAQMKNGTSMPLAWVKLAPQIPGAEHPDVPDAVFLPDGGAIAFK